MKRMIVNSGFQETRVAIVENGRLTDVYMEKHAASQIVGNVYKGKIIDVVPGMQAVFVDIGLDKNAYLPVDEHFPAETPVRRGSELLVQVKKEPCGQKGAKVTTKIMLAGKYLVYLPCCPETGVSRRIIEERERERLNRLIESLRSTEEGIIMRTQAERCDEADLQADLQALRDAWRECLAQAEKAEAPQLIHQDLTMVQRIVRDLLNGTEDEIWIDDAEIAQRLRRYREAQLPDQDHRVHVYRERQPIFERFGIEREIEKLLRRKVWLKSGGYLVIDHTEALTSIDVNTGKYIGGSNLEETVLQTNLEAAEEIARQLRLRDTGGMIIIDFIDMTDEANRERVIERLRTELEKDRAKTAVMGLTQLGLLEMTRQKMRLGVGEQTTRYCDCCHGTGKVMTASALLNRLERDIRSFVGEGEHEAILVEANPGVNALWVGEGGQTLKALEERMRLHIYLKGNDSLKTQEYRLLAAGREESIRRQAIPVREGDELSLFIHETHAKSEETGISKLNGFIINVEDAGGNAGDIVNVKIEKVCRTYAKAVKL